VGRKEGNSSLKDGYEEIIKVKFEKKTYMGKYNHF